MTSGDQVLMQKGLTIFGYAFYYKPFKPRDEQVCSHNTMKNLDRNCEADWREYLKFSDDCRSYHDKFISTDEGFESMWHGPLILTKVMQHRIELNKMDERQIHSAPYHAGPKGEGFRKIRYDELLSIDVIEPVYTEWALWSNSDKRKVLSSFCT